MDSPEICPTCGRVTSIDKTDEFWKENHWLRAERLQAELDIADVRIAELKERCNFKAQRMAKVMEWNEEKDRRIAELEAPADRQLELLKEWHKILLNKKRIGAQWDSYYEVILRRVEQELSDAEIQDVR